MKAITMNEIMSMSIKDIYELCEDATVRLVINDGEVKEIINE